MMRHVCMAGLAAVMVCAGCSSGGGGSRAGDAAPGGAGPRGSAPVASLRGSLVSRDDLFATLAEAAGAVALEEVVLDRVLRERLALEGIAIADADVQAEQERLAAALTAEAAIPEGMAQEQIDRLRSQRGLGPHRFQALLERNAMLRALVKGSAAPTPELIDAEERIVNGERFTLRVFAHPSQAVCNEVRAGVTGVTAPEVAAARFATACARQSMDESAARGGLVEGVSAFDPALPESLRDALPRLTPGDISPVLVTGAGFAMVMLEDRSPPEVVTAREQIERRLGERMERIAMERMARELLRESGLTVVEPSLGWAWEQAETLQPAR